MGSFILLVLFSLVSLLRADATSLFVQTGTDLLLEVKEAVTLEGIDLFIWSVDVSKDIVRLDSTDKITISKHYSGRSELFPKNQSVLLRNLKKNDSGVYRAHVFGDNPKVIAEYEVTVLDPVSPVKLTVKLCSSDSSNLTVTCSTQDSLINTTFTCDDQSCSEERGERAEFSTPAASLKVYLEEDSVICVHSNQASRTRDVRRIEDLCEKDPDNEDVIPDIDVLGIVLPIVGVAFLVLIIVGVLLYHQRRRKYKTQNTENTVYEVPQGKMDVPLEQRPMNDAHPSDPPPTIYHLLGHPTEPEPKPLPESVYATVQKVAKT